MRRWMTPTYGSIRTYQYRYARWVDGGDDMIEFYDRTTDPAEMKNVYNDPAYSETKENLHKQLEELRILYGDNDELNQHFIDEYNEKVKANPMIEYWKLSREDMQKLFTGQTE